MKAPGFLTRNGLIPEPEQIREQMSWPRTSQTRDLIRRWLRIETAGMVLILIGLALLLVAPFASIVVLIWSSVSGVGHAGLHWWIWGVTLGVLVGGLPTYMVATSRRLAACFADGQISEGTVERAIEHPGSGDDYTWYDLRISAELPGGVILRRRVHIEGERWGRRIGRPVRFRHNTLDPDAFDDVLLTGWPDEKPSVSRRGRSSRGEVGP